MTLTAMAVCRLLFVCTFCAVIAAGAQKTDLQKVAEKAEEALAAAKRTAANLTGAQTYTGNLGDLKDEEANSFFTYAPELAEFLASAVKNATEEAKTAADAVKEVQTAAGSSSEAALTTALTEAVGKAEDLSKELNTLQTKVEKIKLAVDLKDNSKVDEVKKDVKDIKDPLDTAKKLADGAVTAHEKVVEEVKKLKVLPKVDGAATNSQKGQQGTEPPPKGQDPNTGNPPVPKDNESSASATTNTSRKDGSTPTPTRDNNDSDGVHGGAITAWVQVPAFLLLAVMAYCAVW